MSPNPDDLIQGAPAAPDMNRAGSMPPPYAPPLVRITMTPTVGKLLAALAAAQGEFTAIPKNRTVTVTMKSGGKYDFDYATLDGVLAATRPALSKHGIAFVQVVSGGGEASWRLTTMLALGDERMESWVELPGGFDGPQELGSYITYLRRYTAVALLGVVADEDDDGNAASGNHAEKRDRGAPPKPATPPATAGKAAPPANGKPAEAVDEEHAATLKRIRACISNELKWEDKPTRAFLKRLFGVELPSELSKPQATVMLQLVLISATQGEDALVAAVKKAKEQSPELFVTQRGAAA